MPVTAASKSSWSGDAPLSGWEARQLKSSGTGCSGSGRARRDDAVERAGQRKAICEPLLEEVDKSMARRQPSAASDDISVCL